MEPNPWKMQASAASADDTPRSSTTPKKSSASISATSSPFISRDSSPSRPILPLQTRPLAPNNKLPSYTHTARQGTGQKSTSPIRLPRAVAVSSSLALLPVGGAAKSPQDPSKAAVVQKLSSAVDGMVGGAQRSSLSPRLRSPPPVQHVFAPIYILNRPNPLTFTNVAPHSPDPADVDATAMPKLRSRHPYSLSPAFPPSPTPLSACSDIEFDPDTQTQVLSGLRSPLPRSPSALETVQEVSLPNSPCVQTEDALDHVDRRLVSEAQNPIEFAEAASTSIPMVTASAATTAVSAAPNLHAHAAKIDSGSEIGGATIVSRKQEPAAISSPLLSRQSSIISSQYSGRGSEPKQDGGLSQLLNHMNAEGDVVEVPCSHSVVPTAYPVASGAANGTVKSLKQRYSKESIRPIKEKEKRRTRKQSSITSGAAPSKADNFEAKIACAVDEANTSDSEETFVYDSNPPDSAERQRRFHSRTPSTTSMTSQGERGNLRSIYSVLEASGTGPVLGSRKGSKFLNTLNISAADSLYVAPAAVAIAAVASTTTTDDDGKTTTRSSTGSVRASGRPHYHFGRWGRNSATGHQSLFDTESPFPSVVRPSPSGLGGNSVRLSEPMSPRTHVGTRPGHGYIHGNAYGVRRSPASPQPSSNYDLDDTTGAGDDENAPLLMSSHRLRSSARPVRPSRSTRRVFPPSPRRLEGRPDQRYLKQQHPTPRQSYLNRFAACLVVTIMLFLVITGATSFMFATSQPLTDIELVVIDNVLASVPELMFDMTLRAQNPNIVVVTIDQADLEVFAKSAFAGSDSDWYRHRYDPHDHYDHHDLLPSPPSAPPDVPSMTIANDDESAPNVRLGTISEFDSPLSFEGSFFHHGSSRSTGEVRLPSPGNSSTGGTPRWTRIIENEFDLIVKGVVKYSLPLSARVRSASISGRATVKPNAANDSPRLTPNLTLAS